jgi:hypothetical protein
MFNTCEQRFGLAASLVQMATSQRTGSDKGIDNKARQLSTPEAR